MIQPFAVPHARSTLLLLLLALGPDVLARASYPDVSLDQRRRESQRSSHVPRKREHQQSIIGAWRVLETASRTPTQSWEVRPAPRAGLYVFSARHYSYAYIPGSQPRPRFGDANQPTESEKAAAYDTFIAGAGSYTFDGVTLSLKADIRKNPNEMTGDFWRWRVESKADTLRLYFDNPPFLPGREWRVTVVRAE